MKVLGPSSQHQVDRKFDDSSKTIMTKPNTRRSLDKSSANYDGIFEQIKEYGSVTIKLLIL